MAAGTLAPTQPKAPANIEPTAPNRGTNRIDEHDADYVRLHSGTVARLQSSLRRYVRELRASGHDAHRQMSVASSFIQRHTSILKDAYATAYREGLRDYYGGASASGGIPTGVTVHPPTSEQQGKRLSFYAPSVAKMAAEGLRALQAEHVAKATQSETLSEPIFLTGGHPQGYDEQGHGEHGHWLPGQREERIGELKGKIKEHQQTIKSLTGVKSKEATAKRAEAREAIKGHRAEIAEHKEALKIGRAGDMPKNFAELKAQAQERATAAKSALEKAESNVVSAERHAARKATANKDEIERVYIERNRASIKSRETYPAAREAIQEARARAKGEAGKAPKTYQKMLAAEQPMKDAQAKYEELRATADASRAARDAVIAKYSPKMGPANYGFVAVHEQLMKDHPDYKAAWRKASSDKSAAQKANYAMYRKQATYEGARNTLAGKVTDEEIRAHPIHAPVEAQLRAADAKIDDLNGQRALRAATAARNAARNELNVAEMAVKFPTWKYDLHSEPINSARYTSPEKWPTNLLEAARAADNGTRNGRGDPHKGDPALLELERAQGYDAKPDIATEEEIDHFHQAGEVELWRGDSKMEHTDNLMAGDYHAGLGIRGNGTYAQQAEYQGKATAMSYAKDHSDGIVMRMTIKKGAHTIDYQDLKDKAHAAARQAERAEQESKANGDTEGEHRARLMKWLATSDTSRFATALGYDAIRILPQGQWIILNRTALRVSHQVRDKA